MVVGVRHVPAPADAPQKSDLIVSLGGDIGERSEKVAELYRAGYGGQVLLSVTDHGPGIPEADRRHAVERFVRLEASRTQPGSGLGLSLASAVATLHGGDLALSDARPGLRATLTIPARAANSDRLAVQTPDVPQKVA